jgi:hypothetical protein
MNVCLWTQWELRELSATASWREILKHPFVTRARITSKSRCSQVAKFKHLKERERERELTITHGEASDKERSKK